MQTNQRSDPEFLLQTPHIEQWAQLPQQEAVPFFLSLIIFIITRTITATRKTEIRIVPSIFEPHNQLRLIASSYFLKNSI